GSPAPAAFLPVPAGIGAAVRRGAKQRNQARRIGRPEDLFQILAKVLTVIEDDVVFHHQIGVGIRMTKDGFAHSEVEIRKGPDPRVAGRDGAVRVTRGARRREVFEDPGELPAGPDDAVDRPLQGRDVPRSRPDSDGPGPDRRPPAGWEW